MNFRTRLILPLLCVVNGEASSSIERLPLVSTMAKSLNDSFRARQDVAGEGPVQPLLMPVPGAIVHHTISIQRPRPL